MLVQICQTSFRAPDLIPYAMQKQEACERDPQWPVGRESQIDSMKTPLHRKNFVLIPSGETLYDGIHTYLQIYQL